MPHGAFATRCALGALKCGSIRASRVGVRIADAYLSGGDATQMITLLQQALDMDRSPPVSAQLSYLG